MAKKKRKGKRRTANPAETLLEPAGDVVVTARDAPPKPAVARVIHERRFPPPIPKAPGGEPDGSPNE